MLLNQVYEDVEYKLYLGLKHISPYIEEAVEKCIKMVLKKLVTVVLAPHYSSFSVGSYNKRAKESQ